MKKTLSRFIRCTTLVIAALAASGCGAPAGNDGTLKVGLIVELTGDMPAVGTSSRSAARLAVDELNSAGGLEVDGRPYRIELVIEDNSAKADQSAAVTNKLINQDQVLAIVGPNASLGAIPA